MLVALFSDLHAIRQALDALQQDLAHLRIEGQARQVDAVWCLGDLVGYGPLPTVVRDVHEWIDQSAQSVCLRGNHDDALLKILDERTPPLNMRQAAAEVLSTHATILQSSAPEEIAWLRQLQAFATPLPGVALAHGYFDPDDQQNSLWLYGTQSAGYRRRQVESLRKRQDSPFLIALGHYHMPGLWQFEVGERIEEKEFGNLWETPWFEFPLDPQRPVMLNTGSISLPRFRDGNDPEPRYASYVLLDFDETSVRIGFRRLFYNVEPLIGPGGVFDANYTSPELLDRLRRQVSYCRSNEHR